MMIGYKMFARCCGQNYWNFIEFLFVFTFLVFFLVFLVFFSILVF